MSMKIIHKNKKEDIKLLIDLGADYHGEDIVLTFSAGQYGLNKFVCSYVGGVQTNCVVNNSTVLCLLDNHGLSLGMLSVEIDIRVPDTQMPDGDFRHVTQKIASFVLGGEECSLELTNGESDYFPIESVPEAAINLLSTVIKGEPGKDADIEGCNAAIASARELEEAVTKAEAEREKAENERQSSETERKQSEEARLQSESERNKAEQARKLAEEERNDAEASRNTAETQRVEAERQRQKDVEDAIASMESAERKATDATIAAQSATENANNATSSANEATANAVAATQNAQSAAKEAVTATVNANTAVTNANIATENATNATNRATELSNKAEETIAKSEKAASDAASAVEDANKAVETANNANKAATTAVTNANTAAENATTAVTNANTAAENATTAVTNANTAAENANAAADRANEAADLVYNGPEEVVSVALYSAVEGVTTAGLDLYVYINDNSVPLIYTTNENGMATFRVTKGLRYDIVFPDITGCAHIGRLSYTAALQTRGIEVTYREYVVASTERVTIAFRKYPENTTWNGGEIYADGIAYVTINDVETVYHADSNGFVVFEVPIGEEYNVRVEKPDGLHLLSGVYSSTYTAEGGSRFIPVSFHLYLSSFLIIDADGGEWTMDGWEAAGKEASEAKLLHVATEELLTAGCDFFMSLDMMAYGKYDTTGETISKMQWATQKVEFTSIPLNGNDATKDYYYDGLTATKLIVDEGTKRGISTPCHTTTLRQTFTLGLETFKGFTPSYGQWAIMIANYTYINSIVTALRPDGDVVTKFWGIDKGVSAQSSASHAWYVGGYFIDSFKNFGYFAPFTAYAKSSL